MYGKIFFHSTEALVEFLAEFTGKCTATFECKPNPECDGGWIIEFGGGH